MPRGKAPRHRYDRGPLAREGVIATHRGKKQRRAEGKVGKDDDGCVTHGYACCVCGLTVFSFTRHSEERGRPRGEGCVAMCTSSHDFLLATTTTTTTTRAVGQVGDRMARRAGGYRRTSDDDGVFMHNIINSELTLRVWRMIRLVKIPEKRKKTSDRTEGAGGQKGSALALGSDGLEVNDDECYQPQKKRKKESEWRGCQVRRRTKREVCVARWALKN